jgi:hypothetical protein
MRPIALLVAMVALSLSISLYSLYRTTDHVQESVLRASRIDLVGPSGDPRVSISAGPGSPEITFYDESGRRSVSLRQSTSMRFVGLECCDEKDRPRIALIVADDAGKALVQAIGVSGVKGATLASNALGVGEVNVASGSRGDSASIVGDNGVGAYGFYLLSESPATRAHFAVYNALPSLSFYDTRGKERMRAGFGASESSLGVRVHDADGRSRVMFGARGSVHGMLFLDADGNVVTSIHSGPGGNGEILVNDQDGTFTLKSK